MHADVGSQLNFNGLNPTKITLLKGKIVTEMGGSSRVGGYKVQTPNAIVSSEGKNWQVHYDFSKTEVMANDASVLVTSLDKSRQESGLPVSVSSGNKTSVEDGKAPSTPAPISESEKNLLKEAFNRIQNAKSYGQRGILTNGFEKKDEGSAPSSASSDMEIGPIDHSKGKFAL